MYDKTLSNLFDVAFGLSAPNFSSAHKFESIDGKTYQLALPGYSKQDLSIEVDGRVLSISAKIEQDQETKLRHSFHKRYTLPDDADVDSIEATMENGVLSLTFGSKQEVKKINIL
jgi:HSP20 family protein